MKKLLAFILAVTMIATLIPSAFAVGGEETAYDGVKMVYDLRNIVNGVDYTNAKGTTFKSVLNYTATNGLFKYVRSSATSTKQPMNVVGDEVISKTSSGNVTFGGSSGNGYVRLWNPHYVCFEVVIPEDGTYKLATEYLQATRGGKVNIHITPADEFYALTTLSASKVRDDEVLGEAIGSYDCKGTATNANFAATSRQDPISFEKTLSAGKYIITYQSIDAEGTVGTFTLSSGTNPKEITNGGYSIKYDIEKAMVDNEIHHNGGVSAGILDYNLTNDFFEIAYCPTDISYASTSSSTYHFMKLKENSYITFKIKVPEKGIYSLKTAYQLVKDGTKAEIYVDGSETKSGEYDCCDVDAKDKMGANITLWSDEKIVAENLELEAGEHTITIKALPGNTAGNDFASVSTFELISGPLGTLTTDMGASLKLSDTNLTVGDTATVSAAAYLSDGSVDTTKTASGVYTSSDTSVATVSGTTITAVCAGTADIMTTIGEATAKRTITVLNKEVSGNVSLGVYSDVDGYVTVTVDEATSDVKVDSVAVGSWVRATAKTDDPNYIFRGWKRGSRDNGVWISEDTEIYFPIMTNTFLTAVYEPVAEEEDTVNVEFYNFNGQYLNTAVNVGTKTFDQIVPATPSLTGYSNPFWTIDGVNAVADDTTFQKLTRIVANYRNKESFDITIGDGLTAKISGTDTIAKSGEYDYDTVLILSSEKEGSWYIDGKLVAYGNAYALNVWNDAEITFDEKENNVPIIALDGETKANGARMISYDANGKNIAEVGIIFGEDAEITSFESKATSKKRGNSQGQFTAMPYAGNGKNARGYLIYNDNGTYRVIYAD